MCHEGLTPLVLLCTSTHVQVITPFEDGAACRVRCTLHRSVHAARARQRLSQSSPTPVVSRERAHAERPLDSAARGVAMGSELHAQRPPPNGPPLRMQKAKELAVGLLDVLAADPPSCMRMVHAELRAA